MANKKKVVVTGKILWFDSLLDWVGRSVSKSFFVVITTTALFFKKKKFN